MITRADRVRAAALEVLRCTSEEPSNGDIADAIVAGIEAALGPEIVDLPKDRAGMLERIVAEHAGILSGLAKGPDAGRMPVASARLDADKSAKPLSAIVASIPVVPGRTHYSETDRESTLEYRGGATPEPSEARGTPTPIEWQRARELVDCIHDPRASTGHYHAVLAKTLADKRAEGIAQGRLEEAQSGLAKLEARLLAVSEGDAAGYGRGVKSGRDVDIASYERGRREAFEEAEVALDALRCHRWEAGDTNQAYTYASALEAVGSLAAKKGTP